MYQNEELKLHKFNIHLNKVQNQNRINKGKNGKVLSSNDKNIYHFQIELEELIHNPRIKPEQYSLYQKNFNIPPQQEILLDLFGNKINKNNSNIISCDLISPCVNKSLWYHKNNLIRNRTLKIIIKLDNLEMTDILRNCLYPEICLDPEKYIIKDNPQMFTETVNELRNKNDTFNYIFNFWKYIPFYALNNDAVYKLKSNIHQIDEKCL